MYLFLPLGKIEIVSVWRLLMILFSGQIDFFDPEIYDGDSLFMGTGAVIFVIDAQDDYVEMEAIQKLTLTVTRCGHQLNFIFLPFL